MKNTTTIIILALLALTTGLRAQDNNAAKLALAREAISLMKVDKTFESMGGQIKQMALHLAPLPKDATPEQRKQFDTFMGKVTELSVGEMKTMIGKMDAVYADVYSESELKAIIAFFKSPEGQSMMAKQPQVMAHIMPLVQEMQQSMMPKMQALAQEFQKGFEASAK